MLAWAADASGAERFTLRIRDLATGDDTETVSTIVNGAVVWGAGSDVVAYTEVNDNWRTFRARAHALGSDPAGDPTLYEETADIGFNVHLGQTHDRRWIIVGTNDHETSELRLLPADDLAAEPLLVSPRQAKRQYSLDSAHGKLWILTNDDHVNFRLASADPAAPGDWTTVIAGSDGVYLRGVTSFATPPRRRGARRRARPDPAADLRWRRAPRALPGGELYGGARHQPRVRHPRLSHRLCLDGHARHGLRL